MVNSQDPYFSSPALKNTDPTPTRIMSCRIDRGKPPSHSLAVTKYRRGAQVVSTWSVFVMGVSLVLGRARSEKVARKKRRQVSGGIESAIQIDGMLGRFANRVSVPQRIAKRELCRIKTLDTEFSPRTSDLQPNASRIEYQLIWRGISQVDLHQFIHRPRRFEVADASLKAQRVVASDRSQVLDCHRRLIGSDRDMPDAPFEFGEILQIRHGRGAW